MNDRFTRAPHRRATDSAAISPHAALMIDFDNVTMGIRSNLGHELRKLLDSDIIRGKVSVQRAYADWRRYPQYIVPLSEASIDLIFAPAYGASKKNATDIRLAIDALELVFTRPEIGTFILLSGDSDFSSLVLKLKEYGKYVIGVGMQESSSDILIQNCDEYYSYNSLSGLTSAADGPVERLDPWELCRRALERMVSRNDVMRSDRLKQVMLELDSAFDEKSIGFSKFNRFLAEARSRGIVELHKLDNGQYEVGPASGGDGGGETTVAERERGSGSRGRGRSARGRRGGGGSPRSEKPAEPEPAPEPPAPIQAGSLRKAYQLLQNVVRELTGSGGEPVRDSEVKRRMLDKDGGFDETSLGFSKFSRFLRQAHDEEVVNLFKGTEGNYHLSPVDSSAGTGPQEAAADHGGEADREPRRERGGRRGGRRADEEPETEAEPEEAGRVEAVGEAAEEPAAVEEAASPGGRGSEPRSRRVSVTGRRGSAARSRKPSTGQGFVPGPVEETGEADASAPAVEETSGAGQETAAPAAETDERPDGEDGRRTLGRFRRGSRHGAPQDPGATEEETGDAGAAGSAGTRAGESAAAASEGGGGAASDSDADSSGLVEYMVRNYQGVGRKTAESLVESFGEDVMEVIDEQPGRLAKVLPEHRARAVIEARQAERDTRQE